MDANSIIDFTPSYRTITATGKSHFSRVSDALAEFVDNSLQAMHQSGAMSEPAEASSAVRRLIEIKIFFDERSSIVISDNGEGMDTAKLREYATFALEQDMRKTAGKDYISKFGVGAKQAGFYIGDSITIITKRRNAPVLTFELDEARLEQRAAAGGAVFQDSVVVRDGPREPADAAESPMQQYVAGHEGSNSHFTIIILRMRKHIESSMRRHADISLSLSQELASIYHFHLHPEDLPNDIVRSARFHATFEQVGGKKMKNGTAAGVMTETIPIRSSFTHVAANKDPPLELTLEVIQRGPSVPVALAERELNAREVASSSKTLRRLASVKSGPHRLLREERAYPFRFNLTIPDPRPEERAADLSRETSRLARNADDWGTSMTGSAINMSVVEGIIFYYPTKAGCPSKPKIKSKITVLDHDDMSIDGMDQQDDVEEDVKPAMVDVYWQDRLVPETKLTALPFIPDAKTSAQCDKLKIPANWRDRLHGFLFFGWDFKHISNNKLKFQVDPSMDDWLNDKNRFRDEIQSDPKSLKDRFLTWLQFCHQHFDQDCVFFKRDEALCMRYRELGTVFSCMKIGVGDQHLLDATKTERKQNIVKLKVEKKSNVCVSLVGFLVPSLLPSNQSEYHGTDVKILCHRAPSSIFGIEREPLELPLSAYDMSKTATVEKDCLQDLRKKAASAILVRMLHQGAEKLVEDAIEINAGDRIDWIAVQIRNERRQPVFCLPDAPNLKYTISAEIRRTDQSIVWANLCKSAMVKDPQASIVAGDSNSVAADKYFFFQNLANIPEGTHDFVITVKDDNREVISCTKVLKVCSGPPASFSIIFSDDSIGKSIPLGEFMPDFKICFFDSNGNAATYTGEVKIEIACPDMTVMCDNIEDEWLFPMNEESFLEFESGIWKAVPKNPALGPLISGTDVTDSTFEFALKCSLCDDRTETFRLRFSPGAPSRMNVLQEHIGHVIDSNALYSISLSRDFPAETFTLVLFDAYGNRTGPDRSERWTVSADTGGPLEHFNPIVCNPDGTITVQDLRPKASALGFMVQTLKLNSSKNNKRFKSLTWDFGVTVSMSRKPSALKIIHNGRDITGEVISCEAGTTLSDLRVVFVDEHGDDVTDIADSYFSDQGGINVSWAEDSNDATNAGGGKKNSKRKSKRGAIDPSPSMELPSIRVDDLILDPFNQDYTVDVVLLHIGTLLASFQIKIVPAEAKEWQILYFGSPHEGIMVGEQEEFDAKIKGLCLRDRFGNMIDPISVRCPPPLLSVEWSGDDGTGGLAPVSVWAADDDPAGAEMCPLTVTDQNGSAEWAVDIALSVGSVGIWTPDNRPIWQDGIFALGTTHGISARKRIAGSNKDMAQQRGVLQCYVAAKAISFRSRVESASGIPIKITLFDAGHHFQSHSIHSFLVPGLPFQLLLKCPDLIINEFTESLAASVTSTRELDTIEAKFVDKFGNDATVGAIKTCKVDISLGSEELISKKSNKGNLIHKFGVLKMSKVIDKLNDTSSCEITLKCNGAFELKGGDRGEERRVHPASMSLRLVKNNRVVDLDIRLLRLKGSEERDEIACLQGSMITGTADQCMTRQYTVSISDEFDISVGVLTEDSADCTPDSDSYEILSAKFCPFETPDGDVEEPYVPDNYEFRGRNEDISSLFSPLLGNSGYFRHALSNVTEPATHLKIGLYEFAVAYTEKREGAQYQIKGRKKIVRKCYVLVTAGPPVQLKVDADSRIVTHVALGDPIGSNIKIIAVDANGNTCSIRGSEDVAVYCRLLKCDDSAAAEEVEISGSQMTPMGLVLFANRNDDGTFVFPSIVLSEKIRGNASERTCGLEDVVLAIECKGFLSESPRRIPIRYYNNAAYAKKLDDIAKQHENLLGEIRAFDIEKIELKNRLNRKETEIKQLLERLKKFSTGIYPFSQEDSHGLTKASFSDYLQQSKQYVQSMEAAASQSRPAIKGSDYNNNHTLSISLNLSIPSVGVVVDLGYVLEEADARVLSWAAQQYLPAAVVFETADAMMLIENGCSKVMLTKRGNGNFLKRLEAEAAALLAWPCRPTLMLEMIEMLPNLMHLKETLFFEIFRGSLLVRNKDELLEVREFCNNQGKQSPPLYSLDGFSVSEDGLFTKMPDELGYVFGQQAVLESGIYEDAKEEFQLLVDHKYLIYERDDLRYQLRQFELEEQSSIMQKRQEAAACEDKMAAIKSTMKEAVKEDEIHDSTLPAAASVGKRNRSPQREQQIDLETIVKRGRR